MKFPNVDWASGYETACIAAIEAYVAERKQHQPDIFSYRGIDLTGAVERQIYASILNDPAIQYLYACHLAGERPARQPVPPELRGPAQHLFAQDGIGRSWDTKRLVSRMLLTAPPLARLLRQMLRPSGRPPPRRPILAAVHHPKFVRYLRPIADALPGQMGFLLTARDRSPAGYVLGDDEWGTVPQMAARPSKASWSWPALCLWTEELAAVLDEVQPACVLCVEGDAPYHEIVAGLARQRGIPAFCLQWGAFPYRNPRIGFRRLGHDAFLAWGEGFIDQLRPFNPDLRFIAVGNHMISATPSAPTRRVTFLMQGVDQVYISEQNWRDFLSFTAFVTARYPNWQIVIRPHPSLPLTQQEIELLDAPNVVIHDPAKFALRESLEGAALAVTLISSAVLEAVAQGVVPFLFNPTSAVPRFKPDFETWQAGIETKTLTEAQRQIAALLDDGDVDGPALSRFRPGLDKLRRHFFAATGPAALDAITSLLRQTIGDRTAR